MKQKAFTLVETMATIAVLAVIGSIASFIIVPAVSGFSRADAQMQIHTELTMAMDRMERALRAIPLDADAAPDIAPNISSITPNSITWNTNWSIALSGSEVLFTEAGGTPRVMLEDVTSFSIEAFDESNAAMDANLSGQDCDAVRRLRIAAVVERAGASHMLRTKVFIRSTVQGGGT